MHTAFDAVADREGDCSTFSGSPKRSARRRRRFENDAVALRVVSSAFESVC